MWNFRRWNTLPFLLSTFGIKPIQKVRLSTHSICHYGCVKLKTVLIEVQSWKDSDQNLEIAFFKKRENAVDVPCFLHFTGGNEEPF